jgi:hypothetical protein
VLCKTAYKNLIHWVYDGQAGNRKAVTKEIGTVAIFSLIFRRCEVLSLSLDWNPLI